MTSRQPFSRSKRLGQDSQERHALDEYKTSDDGRPTVAISGNGTSEEIGVHIPIGHVSNPTKGQDIEAVVGSHGEDPHNKLAQLTQPEKTRYKAKAGEHGHQDPEDANEVALFTKDGQRVRGKKSRTVTNDKDIRHESKAVASNKGDKAANLVSGSGWFEIVDGIAYINASKIVFSTPPIIGKPPQHQ